MLNRVGCQCNIVWKPESLENQRIEINSAIRKLIMVNQMCIESRACCINK